MDDHDLTPVLSEFARTLLTDFPIQETIDRLLHRVVDVLPITGAAVSLMSEGMAPRFVAASDAAALHFELLQSELGQGPCLTVFERGEVVLISDLRSDRRYSQFTPAALAAGLIAVFTFPLRHRDTPIGALDLYRDEPGSIDLKSLRSATTFADVASAYLVSAQGRDAAM
ncbi:MAG TPA: GAF domain-containing protein, partial [Acidimicrobiia bacterium]|nr:GAF domain-containing protein [Acidimicrobiia bacterium]